MFGASKTNSASTGGYTISKSLRTRASASAYLNRTPASAGNQKTWTWSSWLKRGSLSSSQCLLDQSQDATNSTQIYIQSSDSIRFFTRDGGNDCSYDTNAVFRDCSSWYHVVVSVDTTQATASNRVKIYINGTLQTLTTSTNVSQNANTYVNSTNTANIARIRATTSAYLDGYLSEVHFVDGQALTPSSFGATDASTGVWQPARYTGTYGTNGFYLPFTDVATTSGSNAGLGKDFSGNGNYWNTNNISVTSGATYDSMTDVPTLTSATVANYPTLNYLDKYSTISVSQGNLQASTSSGDYNQQIRATMGIPTTGKWYWEIYNTGTGTGGTGTNLNIGIATNAQSMLSTGTYVLYNEGGYIIDGVNATSGYATFGQNTQLAVAYDADANKIYFYKNNVLVNSGGTTIAISGSFLPIIGMYSSGNSFTANFGQQPFAYTPPSGFKALNTYNLPTPTIGASATTLANKYFAPTLYTGNGYPNSGTQSITNSGGFQPDLVWIKVRSASGANTLTDSVRGTNSQLFSNLINSQENTTDALTSFNSNGFSLGANSQGTYPYVNNNGQSFVGWQWKGGNSSGVSNTDGSITSTVSASQASGFSVVTYTGNGSAGATIGHGLGVAPSMIIVKSRVNARSWNCYHSSLGNTQAIYLNSTSASASNILFWNNTSPNSTVFTVGSGGDLNANGETFVAYCFSQVAGFSAMGSYVGNGSTDGPFIYTGFRPAYVLMKSASDTISDWIILDNQRNTYNVENLILRANTSDVEASDTYSQTDFVSNGFKARSPGSYGLNKNGTTYIYMAFAENPFKYSLAR